MPNRGQASEVEASGSGLVNSNNNVKVTVVPPALQPLNTKSEDMVREWSYWQRSLERYCRLSNLTKVQEKLDVFYAYVGRETEEYLRDLPDYSDTETVESLIAKVTNKYTRTPNILCERLHSGKLKFYPVSYTHLTLPTILLV